MDSARRVATFNLFFESTNLMHTFTFNAEEWGWAIGALVAKDGSLMCFSSEGKVTIFNSDFEKRLEFSRWSKSSEEFASRHPPSASDFDFFCWVQDRNHNEPLILTKLFDQQAQKVSLKTKVVDSVSREELSNAIVDIISDNKPATSVLFEDAFEPGGLTSAVYLAGTLKILDALDPLVRKSETFAEMGFLPLRPEKGKPKGKFLGLVEPRIRVLTKLAIKSIGGNCSLKTSLLSTREGKLQIEWEVDSAQPIAGNDAIAILGADEMFCINLLGLPTFSTGPRWWYENNENHFSLTILDGSVRSITLYSTETNIFELGLREVAKME